MRVGERTHFVLRLTEWGLGLMSGSALLAEAVRDHKGPTWTAWREVIANRLRQLVEWEFRVGPFVIVRVPARHLKGDSDGAT
jgi:hypothetical protein